jgi:hypothetical protein
MTFAGRALALLILTAGASVLQASAEPLPISTGPFDKKIVMENQKKSGGGFQRRKKPDGGAEVKKQPREAYKLPNGETCYHCHVSEAGDPGQEVQIGSVQKGDISIPYLTTNSWVHESAISVAIVGHKNASEVNLRIPWVSILWVKSGGVFIDKSRFFERSSSKEFGITNFASGKTIEVFYRSDRACPTINDEFKKYDAPLLRNGSYGSGN